MKRQSGPFMTIIFACAAALAAMIAPLSAPLAQSEPIQLVVLGDSLSAGYGLPQEAAFPVVLERALKLLGALGRSDIGTLVSTIPLEIMYAVSRWPKGLS